MDILTPKWDIQMEEKDGKHFYSVNGEPTSYVGVTTILDVADKSHALVPWAAKITSEYSIKMCAKFISKSKDGIINWDLLRRRAKKQWKFERDKAGDFGTQFHHFMEDPNLFTPDMIKTYGIVIKSANLWLKNTKLRLVKGRTKVISKQYGFGGEWDALMQNEKGEHVIVDYKSGKRLYDSAAAQVAAYGEAAKETFGLIQKYRGLVVRVGKEKVEFEEKEVANMEQSFEYFKACLNLYNRSAIKQFGKSRVIKGDKSNERTKRLRTI